MIRFFNRLWRFSIKLVGPYIFKYKRGVLFEKNLILNGWPMISVNSGKINIGKGVTLNSSNYGYHINMHSPVKLSTSSPDAHIYIGDNTRIHGTCIHAYKSIHIGKNCLIAANCQIFDCNRHELAFDNPEKRLITSDVAKEVKICDNVWIGSNCLILPGVEVGEGSVIAAGSIVTKSVPPYTLVGGNPAKILKSKS